MPPVIPVAKILCAKNTCRRYRSKNCQIVHKNQLVYDCNTGHLFRSQLSHHNVVQKADQIRDGILQDHWHCQQ